MHNGDRIATAPTIIRPTRASNAAEYAEDRGYHEKQVLVAFCDYLEEQLNLQDLMPICVGWNVIEFDMRFLVARLLRHGLMSKLVLPGDVAVGPPWRNSHCHDLMHYFPCTGEDSKSLHSAMDLIGEDVQDTISGADVWKTYQAGKLPLIMEHCRQDVIRSQCIH